MDYIMPKPVNPKSNLTGISFSLIRPSSTTQYTTSDVLASSTGTSYAIALDGIGEYKGQFVQVVGGFINSSNAGATLPQFDLFLFNTPPASPSDNAAFAVTDAEMLTCAAVVTCDTWTKSSNNSRGQIASNTNIPCKLGASTTSMYMLIVVKNGYTPAANEVISGTIFFKREL